MPLARSPPLGTTSGLCGKSLELRNNRRSLFLDSERRAASLGELVPSQPLWLCAEQDPRATCVSFPKTEPSTKQSWAFVLFWESSVEFPACVAGSRAAACQASRTVPSFVPGLIGLVCLGLIPGHNVAAGELSPWLQACSVHSPEPAGSHVSFLRAQGRLRVS